MNIDCVVAALLGGREEKIEIIIKITRVPPKNWKGQVLEVLVQTFVKELKLIPETMTIHNNTLIINAEGRRPRCFKCGKKRRVKTACNKDEQREVPSATEAVTEERASNKEMASPTVNVTNEAPTKKKAPVGPQIVNVTNTKSQRGRQQGGDLQRSGSCRARKNSKGGAPRSHHINKIKQSKKRPHCQYL